MLSFDDKGNQIVMGYVADSCLKNILLFTKKNNSTELMEKTI